MEDIHLRAIHSIHIYRADRTEWVSRAPRKACYLAYQRTGCYIHTVDGRTLTAAPHTVLFLNRLDTYRATETAPGESLCAVIDMDNPPPSFLFDATQDKTVYTLFLQLLAAADLSLLSNRYTAYGLVYQLFGHMSRQKEKAYLSPAAQEKVATVCEYIHRHYGDSALNVEALAEIGGVSSHRLNTLFRQECHVSCWQYVINTRLNAAANLLDTTDYSIRAVSEICGFGDPYYFSRLFKKQAGRSPAAFRKAMAARR